MKILFATSEVFPYSKSGGLGDMASFLPKSLNKIGEEVIVITPYYRSVIPFSKELKYLGTKELYVGSHHTVVNYYSLIEGNTKIVFVQNQQAFERDNYYGYDDDALRFMILSYAVLEYVDLMDLPPQIIHVNDWQTSAIPHLLDVHYREQDKYRYIHTLLTIHNLNYQGNFGTEISSFFKTDFDFTYVHFGDVNLLKSGIVKASKINTVSPSYRNEILGNEFGFSLDGSLGDRKKDLVGILNGIDYEVFNPETDPYIDYHFTTRNLKVGKQHNKISVLNYFNVYDRDEMPLISYIGRLVSQKGIHLMEQTLEDLIYHSNATIVILGSGDNHYQNYFNYLKNKYPNRVLYYEGYNEELAHKIYAGSDIFLMPSMFEPCGLSQMMSMRYGTIPIVRETGGLRDTVTSYNKFKNTGTGFSFYEPNAYIFKEKIYEALELYNNEPTKWGQLMRRAMKEDFSLNKMAKSYQKLYKEIVRE